MKKNSHDSLSKDKEKDKSHYYKDADTERAKPSNNILPDPDVPFLHPFNVKEYL